jgi:hypothetical protein
MTGACRGRVDRLTKLTMYAVDYSKNIEKMTRMIIKKRPPADPLLRRSNRAELRRRCCQPYIAYLIKFSQHAHQSFSYFCDVETVDVDAISRAMYLSCD